MKTRPEEFNTRSWKLSMLNPVDVFEGVDLSATFD